MSQFRGVHECAKNGAGWLIIIHIRRSFRMPLHRENEVIRIGSLDSLDHTIFGATSDHAQSVTQDICRLVMAGVDRNHSRTRSRSLKDDFRQSRVRLEPDLVCYSDLPPRLMIDPRFDVLNESSAAIDIENLQAVTDPEDRLFQIVGILQQ